LKPLDQTFDELAALPMFRAERPATDQEIDEIEAQLNVVLPLEYVRFLQRFGYAHWFGHQIYGIRPTNPETGKPAITPDCVKLTNEERDPSNPLGTARLPSAHVVISTDGGGGNFVLFTAGSPYEGAVHWYNFEDQGEPIKAWKTFQDFLEYAIENSVEP
jgi:hypothetical protein